MEHSGSPNFEDLTRFATEVLQRVGDEALKFYGKGDPAVRFDSELVTEAELRLADLFRSQLNAEFPQHKIFGDGMPAQEYTHGEEGHLWIYDSLDGVANFQAGIPIWGTSLALYENFWPIFGMFYMPVTGDSYYAQAGQQAYCGKTPIHPAEPDEISNESVLLTYSRFHNQYRSTFPGKIRNLGCTAAHLCYVAHGRAEAALIANVSYQDLAAAQIILKAAGGRICKMDGSDFFLNDYLDGQRIEDHLLAAPENSHSNIQMYLQKL
ncbi:inositol monophosphatase family protein [Desulfoferrobacter suflitae]|uniref:inositol monophosphatase family protein n=1 Tax=Desulfoferrobacter suflitae TaxID=2865782 RepID=UPI0021641594|nr:inositol monophosphatase family protein [Desulfoferrobacter suflitae]MCK8602783.1 inositol monophosphatase [Desulfoferrobacter suflitae]